MAYTKDTLRILLIDDSRSDVELIVLELGKDYHIVWDIVENESGLTVSLNDEWDVILCDHHLPRFSPERALEMIRNSPVNFETPVIIISGVVDETEAIAFLRRGAQDFVGKGFLWNLAMITHREIRSRTMRRGDKLQAQVI